MNNQLRTAPRSIPVLGLLITTMVACGNNPSNDAGVIDTGSSRPDIQDVQTASDVTTTDVQPGPDVVATTDVTLPDGGTDAGAISDGGGFVDGCFVGHPSRMIEFLNRCTSAETASRTISAPLLLADGGVPPLP